MFWHRVLTVVLLAEQQRIDVDTVTGATNSGLVIEKACENALSGVTTILK